MCKVSDWFPIAPLCSLWPKASVGNVIVNSEDLLKLLMLNFIYFNMDLNLCLGQVNMQLCGFHCIPGTVLVFIFINPSNFIHFTCLCVVYRDFLWLRFTKCTQTKFISFNSTCTTTVQYRMVYFVSFSVIVTIWLKIGFHSFVSAQWRLSSLTVLFTECLIMFPYHLKCDRCESFNLNQLLVFRAVSSPHIQGFCDNCRSQK